MQFAALMPTKDRLGRLFDPTRFKPKLDALGRWVNARAGRKPTKKTKQLSLAMSSDPTATAPAPAAPSAEAAPDSEFVQRVKDTVADFVPPSADAPAGAPPPPLPSFDDIEKAAGPAAPASGAAGASAEAGEGDEGGASMTTAETIINIIQTALVLIGDDEGVLSKTEKMMLRPPLERVLKKYDVGADVLPAEVDLAVALAVIVITRLKKPKTATWFMKVKMWLGGKAAERQGRALASRVEEATK